MSEVVACHPEMDFIFWRCRVFHQVVRAGGVDGSGRVDGTPRVESLAHICSAGIARDNQSIQETDFTMSQHHGIPKFASALALAVSVAAIVTTAATAAAPRSAKVIAMFVSPKSYKTNPAVTYDQSSVRRGSRVEVLEKPNDVGGLIVQLSVWGLTANKKYNAYVFTRACGATPASAGQRTQNGPSTEHYPQNEVWLNFKTNVSGAAHSQVAQNWTFKEGQANSVVLLSNNAARVVACVTVPFK